MFLALLLLNALQGLVEIEATPVASSYKLIGQTSTSFSLSRRCASDERRSILEIIWSCLITIIACSWVSIHPNVPKSGEPMWRKSFRRLALMFWSIIAPELIIYWAIKEWFGARKMAKKYSKYGWTKTHGYFLIMQGFTLYESKKPVARLSEWRLKRLLEMKAIEIPEITEDEIQDHSKGDGLSKAITVTQTTWFIVQCIARATQGLVITQLELLTLAFAALNIFIYFLWWNKPLNVQTTMPVYLKTGYLYDQLHLDGVAVQESTVLYGDRASTSQVAWDATSDTLIPTHMPVSWAYPLATTFTESSRRRRRRNWIIMFFDEGPFSGVLGDARFYFSFTLVGALFGAIHCIGWNFFFPTRTEAIIWRISSAVITGVPLLAFFGAMFGEVIGKNAGDCILAIVLGLFYIIPIPLYISARLILLVEAVISLRDPPPGALEVVRWTIFIPHV